MAATAFSDYLENQLIDALLRGRAYTPPATVYVALYTVAPTDAGGGTEVSGGSYARVAITAADDAWYSTNGATSGASTGTSGQTSNVSAITFPAPTANWGTIVAAAILDAASGGNFLFWGALDAAKTVSSGDAAPEFAAQALIITLS